MQCENSSKNFDFLFPRQTKQKAFLFSLLFFSKDWKVFSMKRLWSHWRKKVHPTPVVVAFCSKILVFSLWMNVFLPIIFPFFCSYSKNKHLNSNKFFFRRRRDVSVKQRLTLFSIGRFDETVRWQEKRKDDDDCCLLICYSLVKPKRCSSASFSSFIR